MLTFESPLIVAGTTIYRDFSDPRQFYYLPSDHARVSDNGRGLSFVAYTEDITREPDFSENEDRAGGFLTLEVELGPSADEVEALKGQVAAVAGVGTVSLAQVPFTNGSVTLYILGRTGAGGGSAATGFEVSVAGSTKPSLSGRQNAVFSVRLGGKAANLLWETLRTTADPQAVVCYDLEYRGIQPAYHLEVEIDFKDTFSYLRNRLGVNLLAAAVDIDVMTQQMINTGTITVREVDFAGKGNANSPVAGEGGILKLVRDLMSPTLFMTVPIPTPDYRALPDSATTALETAGGTKAFLSAAQSAPKAPIVAGTDVKITHTPIAASQTAGGQVDVSAVVEPAAGVTGTQVKVLWKVQGSANGFQEIAMTRAAATPGATTPGATTPGATTPGATTPGATTPGATTPGATTPGATTPGATTPGATTPGATTPGATTPGATTPGATTPGATTPGSALGVTTTPGATTPGATTPGATTPGATTPGATTPGATTPGATTTAATTPGAADNTYSAKIPGQPAGTTIEYFIRANATKANAPVVQTLPEKGDKEPLSFAFGAASSTQDNGVSLKVPQTDGPLIGYSLRSIDVSQQVKRKFTLDKAEAVTQHYYPSGALSSNNIGPAFDPATQITHVALGQGPFKLIVIKMQAGFDFDKYAVKTATIHIEYGKKADGSLMHALSIPLSKDQPRAQTQFFADENGTQTYTYWVEFVYDPDRVVGTTTGQALQSPKYVDVKKRSITVDLDADSPLIPVQVEPGVLSFSNGLIKQVQVRVSPTPTTEGRVIVLSQTQNIQGDRIFVVPANPASRVYHLQQKFFFQDGSTTIEKPSQVDTQVVVNEPADLVFKMIPEFVDSTGLVKEVLVDAVYKHAAGAEERSTLHLTAAQPRNEFAVLLAGPDAKEWDASFRFVMNAGDPLEAPPQHVKISEPLITLTKAGFRVVTVTLLDDTIFSSTPDLLGVKVTLGTNVNDATLPSTSMMLRSSRTTGSVVVPGVPTDAAVSVATEVLRRNQPALRTTTTLNPREKELFVTL